MSKEHDRRPQGLAAVANPKNPIGKGGLPDRRHREIVRVVLENRDQSRVASQGLSSAVDTLSNRLSSNESALNRIRSTQRWMFATLILILILSGLTAVLVALLILHLNG